MFSSNWENEINKNEDKYQPDSRPWLTSAYGKYWSYDTVQKKWFNLIDFTNKIVPLINNHLNPINTVQSIFDLSFQLSNRDITDKLIYGIAQCAYRGLIADYTNEPRDYLIEDGYGVKFLVNNTDEYFTISYKNE